MEAANKGGLEAQLSGGNEELISWLMDPKFYLENFCKIKSKEGGMIPFAINNAQKDIFNTMKNSSRTMVLKARQIGFCLTPDTKVLSDSLEWVVLDDIKVGQEIVAVDENADQKSPRKMRRAIVEAKWDVYEEAFRLTMENGEELIATGGHRFLSKDPVSADTQWRRVEETTPGDVIRFVTKTWEEPTPEDRWFAGVIDGEGILGKEKGTGVSLTIRQAEGPVLDRLLRYVKNRELNYKIERDKRAPDDSSRPDATPVCKVVISDLSDLFRVFGQCRPTKITGRGWWTGESLPGHGESWVRVKSIEALGGRRMINLQTSEKTFIANGFVSHNSTAITGWLYHKAITTPGINVALVGYNSDLVAELLDKVKTFISTTPEEFRPTIQYNSKYEISFPAMQSKIMVLPSSENVGRGYTIHYALLTEFSAWDKAEEKMISIENSVPLSGKIIIETTPRGVGNMFHRMWMSPDNGYAKKEYGWWWHYTEAEVELIRARMNDPRGFAQEYSLEFLSSGRNVFDVELIGELRHNILNVGDEYIDEETKQTRTVREWEGLRVYREPHPSRMYVAGADVAEGVTGGDFSVVHFWDRTTGEEVGMYRGHLPADKFGEKLNQWGRFFNNALMVVEINNHGLTTVTLLKQLLYPQMYFRPAKFDAMGSGWSDRLGWKTTKVTRPLMIDDLAQAFRDKLLTPHSAELYDETITFTYDDGNNMVAQNGYHDDCIFAAAIGFQGFKVMYDKPLEQIQIDHVWRVSGGY